MKKHIKIFDSYNTAPVTSDQAIYDDHRGNHWEHLAGHKYHSGNKCNKRSPSKNWICTRLMGHKGLHETAGGGTAYARWGTITKRSILSKAKKRGYMEEWETQFVKKKKVSA